MRGSVYECRGECVCRDWAASCACTYVERHACTRVCDSFCPSGLLPHLYTKGGALLLGRPFLAGPSRVLSLAPPPAPPHKQASIPGKREGDSRGLQRTDRAGATPLRGGEGQRPGLAQPHSEVSPGAVPGSRPIPACPSSLCGSARTTTGSPASRRGSRCRGRSRPSPRPRPSAPSCRGASL